VLTLSPVKILIILVVAALLVGPDKLPQVARQVGGAWRAFRDFSKKVEDQVRSNVPDLPSTNDLARYARSPVALLDSLAKLDSDGLKKDPGPVTEGSDDGLVVDPGLTAQPRQSNPSPQRPPVVPPGDPSLN
jgi:TatA/E family protein of Tat protein translocase